MEVRKGEKFFSKKNVNLIHTHTLIHQLLHFTTPCNTHNLHLSLSLFFMIVTNSLVFNKHYYTSKHHNLSHKTNIITTTFQLHHKLQKTSHNHTRTILFILKIQTKYFSSFSFNLSSQLAATPYKSTY